MPAAYRVLQLVHEMHTDEGYIPVGRKIGFTNPEMWNIYGVREPIWAFLYDRTVVHVKGGSAVCDISRFSEPKIEPEIVLHFHSAPPPTGGLEEILDSIDWIAHGIEIVQSHFPGWKFRAADTVSDCSLHGTLLVGKPLETKNLGPAPISQLEDFSVTLACDGRIVENGKGSNVLGSPLKAVRHLMGVIAKQPSSLALGAGEMATTGTLTPARSVQPGETWKTEFSGISLSGLTVAFTG
jgi:2-oxo-3-hexenedioate decarboxylase